MVPDRRPRQTWSVPTFLLRRSTYSSTRSSKWKRKSHRIHVRWPCRSTSSQSARLAKNKHSEKCVLVHKIRCSKQFLGSIYNHTYTWRSIQEQSIGCSAETGKKIRSLHGPTNDFLNCLFGILQTGDIVKGNRISTIHDFVFNFLHQFLAKSFELFR